MNILNFCYKDCLFACDYFVTNLKDHLVSYKVS